MEIQIACHHNKQLILEYFISFLTFTDIKAVVMLLSRDHDLGTVDAYAQSLHQWLKYKFCLLYRSYVIKEIENKSLNKYLACF